MEVINMADIFTVTAPLKIRLPGGQLRVVAELFKHPEGLIYFDLHWHENVDSGVHLLRGELKGEGPWKIDNHIFYVLGCHGTDGELATEFQQWREWRLQNPDEYPDSRMIQRIARRIIENTGNT
jgi:hypothetical protein